MTRLPPSSPTPPEAPAEAVETVVDPPPPARGSVHRPPPARFAPKPGVRAEVRPWGGGAGQDVALALVDLSEVSVRVRLRPGVRASARYEVTLRDPAGRRWARMMAAIGGSDCDADGTVVATLTLGRLLMPDIIRRLGEPAPAARS